MNTETPVATDPQEASAGSAVVVKPPRVRKGREVIIGKDKLPSVHAAAEKLGIGESKLRKQLEDAGPASHIHYADAKPLPTESVIFYGDAALSSLELGDLYRAMLDEKTFSRTVTIQKLAREFPAQARAIIANAKAAEAERRVP